MRGLQEANLAFPDGVSDNYAYQRFAGRNIPLTAELHVTVDGFSASLVCEEASYDVYLASWIDTGYPYLNFTMASNNCQITSGWFGPKYQSKNETYYSRFGTGGCQSSSKADDQRIAVTFGNLKYGQTEELPFPNSPVDVTSTKSVSLLCRPTYLVSKIDAVKNGSDILSLTPSASQGLVTLGNVHAWDITRALMHSTYNPLTSSEFNAAGVLLNSKTFNASDKPIDVDLLMNLALGQLSSAPPSSTTLLNTSFLQNLMISYYQTYAAFIVNDLLVEPVSTESTGQAFMYQARLVVNTTAAHAMAAILAASVLLFGVVMITTPNVSVLACAPSNISGVAKLASHSDTVIQRFKGLGSSDSKKIATRLRGCGYMTSVQDGDASHPGYFEITETNSPARGIHATLENSPSINPAILHSWSRVGVSFLVLGIIGALEATLQVSQRNHGIGVVQGESPYLHYTWTTVPALIFTATGLLYGSIDSNIRKLTPYVNLSRGSTFGNSIGLDLLDTGVPRTLLREIRTRNFAALSGTLAALIASLLATFSSSLFVLSNVPPVATVQLRTESSINNDTFVEYGRTGLSDLTPALILQSNLSYPEFTYETLVFPRLTLDGNTTMDSGFVLNATIPAVRPKLDCRLHDSSTIVADVRLSLSQSKRIHINITEEACYPRGYLEVWQGAMGPELGEVSTEGAIAGAVTGVCSNANTPDVPQNFTDWVYFWADIKLNPNPTIASISALVCNESFETVDVSTSFLGADLTIDPDNPPVPNEATARNSTATVEFNKYNNFLLYEDLQTGPHVMLDNFFSTLIASPYAVPLEYLGDPSKSEIVRDAIIFQHGIIRSQQLSDRRRSPPEMTNALVGSTGKNDVVTYYANVTEAVGKIHVVQDVASTRTLQALLIAILAFSLVSWVIMPNTRILPREPMSIASVIALLADGNMFELLPAEWQLIEEKDIERLFSGITFKMGWVQFRGPGEVAGGDNGRFSIYGFQQGI
ncbi:hypothetical protein CIB48_g1925 [Xylaria polymorpha]|nr:hypothetical protein CIB48_g1925 [Xylaria polymorpha]